MENMNKNQGPTLTNRICTQLFEKSAALKKKNNIVMEKLRKLKKMSDEFLKTRHSSNP